MHSNRCESEGAHKYINNSGVTGDLDSSNTSSRNLH